MISLSPPLPPSPPPPFMKSFFITCQASSNFFSRLLRLYASFLASFSILHRHLIRTVIPYFFSTSLIHPECSQLFYLIHSPNFFYDRCSIPVYSFRSRCGIFSRIQIRQIIPDPSRNLTIAISLCREGLFLLPYNELAVAHGPKIYQKNEL
jgi:hypothetical protein